MTRLQLYEMNWKEAQVDAEGASMTFLDSLHRYWEPVMLADPMFCGRPGQPRPQIPTGNGATTASHSAASGSKEGGNVPSSGAGVSGGIPTVKATLLPEEEFDVDDMVFVTETHRKVDRAGFKRRKDTHYL